MSELLLTVSLPNYNHGSFLPERIPSLLAAMPALSELIIVDDGSSDESANIIEHFAAQDRRILYIKKTKNLGVIHSLNLILENAKGKYISFQSADDYILPNFFEKLLEVAQRFPEAGICCSDCGLSYEKPFLDREPGQIYTTHLLEGTTSILAFSPSEMVNLFRKTHFWIPGHASILKMDTIYRLGGFDHRIDLHADWFLLHATALEQGVAYLPQTLSVWRQHSSNYSSIDTKKQKEVYRQILKQFSDKRIRHLRPLFRKATLLHPFIKKLFFEVIWMPQYWDFILVSVFKVLRYRILTLKRMIQ